ncbi:helix-turn-helix domain-containing protein [Streptomyces kanasensis]|uniref:helix-turn-helix domain-containing protein n=1 Tax=Streptomyces kanasensis TaxID=936756 RepID=UPI0036FB8628
MAVDGERPEGAPARRLGAALRALQQRSGRTLRSLEEDVPISDSSLSRYFRGSTVPPWSTVRDLCRALGADPAEYRALWEAAARGQAAGPDADAARAGTAGAGAPGPGAAGSRTAGSGASGAAPGPGDGPGGRMRRWYGAARARLPGRRACAAGGAVVGVLFGALLASLAVPQAPASAPGAPGREGPEPGSTAGLPRHARIFVSRETGRCLDDSLDERLRTYKCNGMSYQWWTVHTLADGSRRLRNHATGRCLDDGAAGLRAVRCAGGRTGPQTWSVTTWSDDSAEVRSRVTGKCLDDSGTGLRTLPCDRTDRQKWG